MRSKIKRMLLSLMGIIFVCIGLVFIVLPGPAFLFLPIGLALLSVQYPKAKVWLRHCQRVMRKSAVQTDKMIVWLRYRAFK